MASEATKIPKNTLESIPKTLAIGEILEIPLKNHPFFSISQKDCLKHKLISKKKLMIRGACQGYGEILLWKDPKHPKKRYQVFILSKRNLLKKSEVIEYLGKLSLGTELVGNSIFVSGELKSKADYKLFQKISKSTTLDTRKLKLGQKIKNEILSEITLDLFQNQIRHFFCEFKNIQLVCKLDFNDMEKSFLKYLKSLDYIKFINSKDPIYQKNFLVRLYIFQIERIDGREISLGLDQIDANLDDLFSNGIDTLISRNSIKFKNESLKASTIAQPETVVKLGQKSSIQIGTEIPFQTTSNNLGSNTDWKFAGLKFDLELNKEKDKILVNFETEVQKPSFGEQILISGSKTKTFATLEIDKPINIFNIKMSVNTDNTSGFPYISRIPILGRIFRGTFNSSNYKIVYGTLKIERI